MTEPGAGSDLQGIQTTARQDGDGWVLSGSKTFITNGINSDLVIVVAKTDPEAAGSKGISLLVVERDMPGFSRGRNLDKVGLKAQDTAELFFDDVRVPAENLLGGENRGFLHLMENLPAGAAVDRRGRRRVGRDACSRTTRRVRDRPQGVRQAGRPRSRTPASSWPSCTPRRRSPAPSSTSACAS